MRSPRSLIELKITLGLQRASLGGLTLLITDNDFRATFRDAMKQTDAERKPGKPPRGHMERELEAWLAAFLQSSGGG